MNTTNEAKLNPSYDNTCGCSFGKCKKCGWIFDLLSAQRREMVEKIEKMKLHWKHPLDKSIPMKDAYNNALDDVLILLRDQGNEKGRTEGSEIPDRPDPQLPCPSLLCSHRPWRYL